jgi:CHAT domain
VAGGAGTLEVPGGRLRVLIVISRPAGTRDVGYQMVARPLLERLEAVRGEVDLTVLRPPTFDALASIVKTAADAGTPFHVVHFDGHGVMPGRGAGGGSVINGRPTMMNGPGEGVLAFELPGGGSDHVGAPKVAAAVTAGRVPVVVLNACQSGAVGKELEASVATALLKSGCAAVVAMAYSVYAVAAVGAFVGRDDLFYQLETAARLQRVVVLAGPGGTGKIELAKGFARWWRDTGGVDDPRLVLWHSFEPGVASFGLDGVITGIGLAVFGTDFARLEPPQRLEAVKQLLARCRGLLVWDNFESVAEMPAPAGATPPLEEVGRAGLREFLAWVRDHSRSSVVITSRAREDWLGGVRRSAWAG